MSNLPLGFLLGFLGSLHCAIMCGPIMLGLTLEKPKYWQHTLQLLSYQVGRVLVYGCLGLVLGLIGSTISLFISQTVFSITIGSVMILFTVLKLTGKYVTKLESYHQRLVKPLSKLMGTTLSSRFWGFYAGMLNGLIPCGMVYLALATAMNTGSVVTSIQFMVLFGLGTTPIMLIISLSGVYLKRYLRFNTQTLVPWFALFIGALFILRGAALGIPYLSPNNPVGYGFGVAECG